jgi:hypothetical protein
MKRLILFLPALLFIIISCSDNEPTEPITYTDAELKAKIVGTWSNDYISIKFDANGNFVEDIDIDYTYGDTTINQKEVIKGSYEIENGILRKNITGWDIINNSFLGGGYMPPASKIIFVRNFLYSYPLEICTRMEDGTDSLWGEWYTFFWMHEYSDPQAFGKREQTYNFNKDSMTVTTGFRYKLDSSAVFYYQTDPLTYNPPEVSWENNIQRSIEFYNGQMWMYYKLDQPPTPLKKEN